MNSLQTFFSNFPFLSVLLGILIISYWFHAFFILYHLSRFGIGVRPKLVALIFFVGSMFLFMLVAISYHQVDFSSFNPKLQFQWVVPFINVLRPT